MYMDITLVGCFPSCLFYFLAIPLACLDPAYLPFFLPACLLPAFPFPSFLPSCFIITCLSSSPFCLPVFARFLLCPFLSFRPFFPHPFFNLFFFCNSCFFRNSRRFLTGLQGICYRCGATRVAPATATEGGDQYGRRHQGRSARVPSIAETRKA